MTAAIRHRRRSPLSALLSRIRRSPQSLSFEEMPDWERRYYALFLSGESFDRSGESEDRVSERLDVRVAAAAVSGAGAADRGVDVLEGALVRHEDSLTVDAAEAGPSAAVDATVEGAADTDSSVGEELPGARSEIRATGSFHHPPPGGRAS